MTDLKDLNLTEEDFKLIIDGLDALPRVSGDGELGMDLMVTMFSGGNKVLEKKLEDELARRRATQKREKQFLIENIRILQGKLLTLKRYMQENAALADVDKIINSDRGGGVRNSMLRMTHITNAGSC